MPAGRCGPSIQFTRNIAVVLFPASALASYYMFIHDMCILLVPIALTLNRAKGRADKRWIRALTEGHCCAAVGGSGLQFVVAAKSILVGSTCIASVHSRDLHGLAAQ
jgi:hypothetical protein